MYFIIWLSRGVSNGESLPTRATPIWAFRHKSLSPTSATAASNLWRTFSMRLRTTFRLPLRESFSGIIKVMRAAATIIFSASQFFIACLLPFCFLRPARRGHQQGLHLFLDICFDEVAGLEVIEPVDADAAFVTCQHFLDVLFKALQGINLAAFGHHGPLAQDPGQGVAFTLAAKAT